MTKTATKTYLVGVIERAISYFKVKAEDARTAAENWHEGDFWDRNDEALEADGPCNVREQQPDGTFLMLPRSQWDAVPSAGIDPVRNPTRSCCFTPTMPMTPARTLLRLRRSLGPNRSRCHRATGGGRCTDGLAVDSEDFAPLLVTPGHNCSQPLFNK